MASESKAATSKPLSILCLDGGGVRGLSSLLILQELLENLQGKHNLTDPPLPCEIFDLICGTSTGGLIAIMLGRLRMSVKDAITCYLNFSEAVFGSTVSFAMFKRIAGNAMYDASILERCIKETSLQYGGDENTPLRDPMDGKDGCCRVFVVAVSRSYANAAPKLFRSYKSKSKLADSCTVWEAARATTAATTFFDPVQVGFPPETFIDGGLSGANNPSKLARQEIQDVFPGRSIGCFLSLGTGSGKIVSISASYASVAKACIQLVTNCEIVDHDVANEFDRETRQGLFEVNPYFRFSVDQGLQTVMLDDWKESGHLTEVTKGYLRHDDQLSSAEKCVSLMKERTVQAEEDRAALQDERIV